jgi:predicted transporter
MGLRGMFCFAAQVYLFSFILSRFFSLSQGKKNDVLLNKVVVLLLQFVLLNYIYSALNYLKSKPSDKTGLHQLDTR